MANIKTAKKMILVHERRRKRNVSVKTRIKNVFKAAIATLEKENSAEVVWGRGRFRGRKRILTS